MGRTDTTNPQALLRIVAVLLALADLAERSSRRSPAVRSLVLWLLRSGEVVARDHLAGLTRPATGQGEALQLPFTDGSAAEALRIAAGFRNLAAALAALAAECIAPLAVAVRCGIPGYATFVANCLPAALRYSTTGVERRDSS